MKYYINPTTGNDDNPGTMDKPWKTIQHGVLQKDRENYVRPGDTLFLSGGRYFETNILFRLSGEKDNPITITNVPGETAIIDGTIQELQSVEEWELVDRERSIYRSRNSIKMILEDKKDLLAGGFFAFEGQRYTLIAYKNKESLFSDRQFEDLTTGHWYVGPGVFYVNKFIRSGGTVQENPAPDAGHIFLRLQAPDFSRVGGKHNSIGSYGQSLSFENFEIHISQFSIPCFSFNPGPNNYLNICGIEFYNHGRAVFDLATFQGCKFSNLDIQTTGDGFRGSISVGKPDKNIFDNIRFTTHIPPWVSFNDAKGDGDPKNCIPPNDPASSVGKRAFTITSTNNIEIRNSHFFKSFDGIFIEDKVNQIFIHNNLFEDIFDDSITLAQGSYDIEVANNKFINVGTGVSHQLTEGPPKNKIGTIYIHHNLVVGVPIFKTRADDSGNPATFRTLSALSATHSKIQVETISPRKIYNNTIIRKAQHGLNRASEHLGSTSPVYQGTSIPIFPENKGSIPNESQEVYNNIFIVEMDIPIGQRATIHTGREIFDGNIYWKGIKNPQVHLLEFWRQVSPQNSNDKKIFYSLAEFLSDLEWHAPTKAYYDFFPNNQGDVGWEVNGLEGDPELDNSYVPIAGGTAATGAIDLKNKNWPGYTGQLHRGAFPPNSLPNGCLSSIYKIFTSIFS